MTISLKMTPYTKRASANQQNKTNFGLIKKIKCISWIILQPLAHYGGLILKNKKLPMYTFYVVPNC